MRENYARNQDRIALFGPIKHYLYFSRWNEPPTAFTEAGELLGIAEGASLPKFELRVGKRVVCERLLSRMLLTTDNEMVH